MFRHAFLSRSFLRCMLFSSAFVRNNIFICRIYNRMERAVVRCVPWESKLTISFTLDGSHKHILRDQTEELGKALARISNNIIKAQTKGKKSKKNKTTDTTTEEPVVRLYFNGDFVAEDSMNSDAWQDGAVLHVGDTKYKIERNPPTFTTAELPASLLAGFPVCPKFEIEFGHLKDCVFKWYKESFSNAHSSGQEDCWVEAGSERVFIPSNLDIGLRLKLKCTPGNESKYGATKELVSTGTVEAGPGVCTFDNRHMYTKKVTDDLTVRVVSYNILADIYAQTELSKTVLYPYCAPYALGLDYRQNLIKKELSGYNADIICLQEVDKGAFSDSLLPALDAFGMDGCFRIKEKQHEGLATFYRRSKFKFLSQHDVMLSEALTTDALHSVLLEKVSTNSTLKEKVLQRSTTLQVTVLQSVSDPSKTLCVGNTHLYWHPKGGNVRLIQMGVALEHLKRLIADHHSGTLIFCGDFNSTPSSGLFQLLCQGSVSENHSDWMSNGPEELVQMELRSPFQLTSACGEPAYTNYVGGFHGCLDYIYIDSQALLVEQVIPMPSHQEVTTYQALPSVSHPSDHIALVCDLKWK
ncbi:2',5'-phosphodiesterase 12 [Electrophorus electricus]|uniref:2',5'-phosphodiesterase 12 n=1 Tax=Electrophorus electricus TaxID=8005 RepID=A0A4W4FDW5_ELEEL|nr:2',5'-phosphodiesterase 12 [Electrophorus electricus]